MSHDICDGFRGECVLSYMTISQLVRPGNSSESLHIYNTVQRELLVIYLNNKLLRLLIYKLYRRQRSRINHYGKPWPLSNVLN